MKTFRKSAISFRTRSDDVTFALCIFAFAVALAAQVGSAAAGEPSSANRATATATGPAAIGTFTGTYQNGVPVYRLPPITVSASRAVETAKIARENERTQAASTNGKAGMQPHRTARGARQPA
jgi:hypothetical protein